MAELTWNEEGIQRIDNLKELGLQKLTLDINRRIEPKFAKENDTKSRGLDIQVKKDNKVIDTTGIVLKMYAMPVKEQEVYEIESTVIDASRGKYEIVYPTVILQAGITLAEIVLTKDEQVISSKKFKIEVESRLLTDDVVKGHDAYPLFEQLLEAAKTIEGVDIAAEEEREKNEIIRQSQEQQRQESMTDIENRFNLLETSKQQDAEVINARTSTVKGKTFNSLNDRLEETEKEIDKPLYSTPVETYDNVISLPDNTTNGVIDCKLKGNTETDEEGNAKSTLASQRIKSINFNSGIFTNVERYPYELIRRCNLSDDRKVLAYYGDSNYREDGSNGQVMVEIPRGYYRLDNNGHDKRLYIASKPNPYFKIDPAFVRNEKKIEKIYLSAYEGCIYDVSENKYLLEDEQVADFDNDKLSSIANAKPCSGVSQPLTIVNSRKLAQNRGEGWELQDFLLVSFIQKLFLCEYGTFDTQGTIGRGVSSFPSGSDNESLKTGQTSHLGNKSGMADGANGEVSVSYRGIENFWGNIWKWVDGINIKDNVPYVADHNFISDKFDGHYKKLGVKISDKNGYAKEFAFSDYFDFGFLPLSVGGSAYSHTYDYYWQIFGSRVARLGGYWNNGLLAGGFCWRLDGSSGSRYRYIGARLMCIPN